VFVAFFPRPKLFAVSGLCWTAFVMLLWYAGGEALGGVLGLALAGEPPIGASLFWSPDMLWFYIYFIAAVGLFGGAWQLLSPHPWARWSIFGSALILFTVWLQVQVSVAINSWYGPFYDLIQRALSGTGTVTRAEFYLGTFTFFGIASLAVIIQAFTRFFASHYVFRWRTAMNAYYMAHWSRLRRVEGASQRVQEDTMRFATTVQDLGVSFLNAVMTLIAFLPVLLQLSANVTELPIIGEVPYPLMFVALAWAAFGTGFLALIGVRLPGLEFRNQRVEAAYRKELVYGEDDPVRAAPPTVVELFSAVRRNYFTLYANYLYFNVGRYLYIQTDSIFPYIVLVPTLAAGKITLGVLTQIINSFEQVRTSFQYLVTSWPTIVELLSIYKRLQAFEATLRGAPLSPLEEPVEVAS
jgi:peptide/bleomycin uptake transporter